MIALGDINPNDGVGQEKKNSQKIQSRYLRNKLTKLSGKIVRIACGYRHTLLALETGRVMTYGWNAFGQCGVDTKNEICSHDDIQSSITTIFYFENENVQIIEVAAGFSTSYAVSSKGIIYSWGQSQFGALGRRADATHAYKNIHTPRRIDYLKRKNILILSAGHHHCLVKDSLGECYGWGRNNYGQVGCESSNEVVPVPTKVHFPSNCKNIRKLTCGVQHSLALMTMKQNLGSYSTTVFGWGERYLLCEDSLENAWKPKEISQISELVKGIKDIQAGLDFSLLLGENSKVYSFGRGTYGQLGNGFVFDQESPVVVDNIGRDIVQIGTGLSKHAWAVAMGREKRTWELWSWGYNKYGQLGLGDKKLRLQPHKVETYHDVNNFLIGTGNNHTVIIPCPMDIEDAMHGGSLRGGRKEEEGMRYCFETLGESNTQPGEIENLKGSYEVLYNCFHCKVQVCMACARKCHKSHAVDPKLVSKVKEPTACCECCIDNNSKCKARFSFLRQHFDKIASKGSVNEGFILLFQVQDLLGSLQEHIEECLGGLVFSKRLMELALKDAHDALGEFCNGNDDDTFTSMSSGTLLDGRAKDDTPISFLQFEEWYHDYFRVDEMDVSS